MRSNTRLFVIAGLCVAAALALFVSGFASSAPDGLERVAADKGFLDTAAEHALGDSPLADYTVQALGSGRLSTGVSGLIGVLLTFALGLALFALLRGRQRHGPDRTS